MRDDLPSSSQNSCLREPSEELEAALRVTAPPRYHEPVPTPLGLDIAHGFGESARALFGERLKSVRLYGSQARGEANEESDVDLLALIEGLTFAEKIACIDLGCEIALARGVHVSVVAMAQAEFDRLLSLESAFAQSVMREGIAA